MKRGLPWWDIAILMLMVFGIVGIFGMRYYQSKNNITLVREVKVVCSAPFHKRDRVPHMTTLTVTVPRRERRSAEALLKQWTVYFICKDCGKSLGAKPEDMIMKKGNQLTVLHGNENQKRGKRR